MHQSHALSWCDGSVMEPDTLSHTYDRVSEVQDMGSQAESDLSGPRCPYMRYPMVSGCGMSFALE